jgi:hypothetical protein
MASIVIKDLTDSIELDRQAMNAITGGGRLGTRYTFAGPTVTTSTRIATYPAGWGRTAAIAAAARTTTGTAKK